MKTITLAVFACIVLAGLGHAEVTSGVPQLINGHMQNVNVESGARYLAALTERPVVMYSSLNHILFNWEGHNLTRSQAIESVELALRKSGCALLNIREEYYKLVPLNRTNMVAETAHIDVVIRNQSITVENQPVSLDSLAEIVGQHVKTNTEVWVSGASTPALEPVRIPGETNQTVRFDSLVPVLQKAYVWPEQIYIVCPSPSNQQQSDTSAN
jgi:hypothetical protein